MLRKMSKERVLLETSGALDCARTTLEGAPYKTDDKPSNGSNATHDPEVEALITATDPAPRRAAHWFQGDDGACHPFRHLDQDFDISKCHWAWNNNPPTHCLVYCGEEGNEIISTWSWSYEHQQFSYDYVDRLGSRSSIWQGHLEEYLPEHTSLQYTEAGSIMTLSDV